MKRRPGSLAFVVDAAGFSGHGFTFASAVEGETDLPVGGFAIDRPAIREA